MGFVFFRLSAILHGVYARAMAGQNSSPKAMSLGPMAEKLADMGWDVVRGKHPQQPLQQLQRQGDPSPSLSPPIVIHPTPHSLSPFARGYHSRVREFVHELILPRENEFFAHATGEATKWKSWDGMEELKALAKKEGEVA